MSPWFLLMITTVFAYLTYDALSLVAPSMPYAEIAKGLGLDLSHLPLYEQEKLNRYPFLFRLGNVNQSVCFFAVLTNKVRSCEATI